MAKQVFPLGLDFFLLFLRIIFNGTRPLTENIETVGNYHYIKVSVSDRHVKYFKHKYF